VVYPQRMMATLNQTGGLIFSQRLLLALVEKGAVRKEAYEHVQKHAMATPPPFGSGGIFRIGTKRVFGHAS